MTEPSKTSKCTFKTWWKSTCFVASYRDKPGEFYCLLKRPPINLEWSASQVFPGP